MFSLFPPVFLSFSLFFYVFPYLFCFSMLSPVSPLLPMFPLFFYVFPYFPRFPMFPLFTYIFPTLGGRDFASAVSGFCQVFIVTRAKSFFQARRTSGTQGMFSLVSSWFPMFSPGAKKAKRRKTRENREKQRKTKKNTEKPGNMGNIGKRGETGKT